MFVKDCRRLGLTMNNETIYGHSIVTFNHLYFGECEYSMVRQVANLVEFAGYVGVLLSEYLAEG